MKGFTWLHGLALALVVSAVIALVQHSQHSHAERARDRSQDTFQIEMDSWNSCSRSILAAGGTLDQVYSTCGQIPELPNP